MRRGGAAAIALALGIGAVGCASTATRVAMVFLYERADLPEDRVVMDVPYRLDRGADAEKHRLDLFLAEGTGWPVLVFIHGGGWTSGDRALRAGGADVYANIGRFYASRGTGVAVISYRLQPEVEWQDQIADAASATAWVHENIAGYGGDPNAIFLSGHSAGAQLATHVALDPEALASLGVAPGSVCGLIAVSGAAYDLDDPETYELGASRRYYEKRFRNGDTTDRWKRVASPVRFARADAPPALILYAGGEWASLQRQAAVLHEALQASGAKSRLVEVPGEDHYRIVLTLSRDDKTAGPAMLDFIGENETRCGGTEVASAL